MNQRQKKIIKNKLKKMFLYLLAYVIFEIIFVLAGIYIFNNCITTIR